MDHKLNTIPSVTLGFVATGLFVTFWSVRSPVDCLIGLVAVTCLAMMARIELGVYLMRLRPFMFFAVLTMVFGGLQRDGHALFFSLRLLLLGAMTVWLTGSVGVSRMVSWLRRLSHRVRRLGIDLGPILTTVTLAITFIPILQVEASRVSLGLRARGARVLGHGPVAQLRLLPSLTIPLLAAALRRAGQLADALDVRTQGSTVAIEGTGSQKDETAFRAGLDSSTHRQVKDRFAMIHLVSSVILAWWIVLFRLGSWVVDRGWVIWFA